MAALCLLPAWASAQNAYWVWLRDKGPAAETLLRAPRSLVSGAAWARRLRHGIALDATDLPVHAPYLRSLAASGTVRGASRWLNVALVHGDSATLAGWPFVRAVTPAVRSRATAAGAAFRGASGGGGTPAPSRPNAARVPPPPLGAPVARPAAVPRATDVQLAQLHLDALHAAGFRGAGVRIAVLDDGFFGLEANPAFQALRTSGRLVATYDFADNEPDVTNDGSHGSDVLSVLAAEQPDFQSAAPEAQYLLLRTEVTGSERNAEELNWLRAAEFADSAGADILSSSLSYNVFDAGQISYTYAQVDGRSTIVTQAAQAAVRKGLLVVTSAGNEGDDPWRYIAAPCDADSILCVGAATRDGVAAVFSGRGPSADGRTKPDVAALGAGTAVVGLNGSIRFANGTSFATPLVAGLAACLLSARPASAEQLRQAIVQSASQVAQPDTLLGFGIPNGVRALAMLQGADAPTAVGELRIQPNPAGANPSVTLLLDRLAPYRLLVYDTAGRLVWDGGELFSNVRMPVRLPALPAGTYVAVARVADGPVRSTRFVFAP